MAKCGYTYDQILSIQSPFTLSEDDLIMVSHSGVAKIISIGELSKFFSMDSSYIQNQYSVQVPSGVSSITVTGEFASAVGVKASLRYTGTNEEPPLTIVRTIVNTSNIIFVLSGTTYDAKYVIDYYYNSRTNPYNYGKVKLTSGSKTAVVENVNFTKVDTLFGTIKDSDGIAVPSIGIRDIKVSSTTATFVFSDPIPNDDEYVLEYKYTLNYNNSDANLIELKSGMLNVSIQLNEDLDIGHLVAEIYNNGDVSQDVYITNISRTGNAVVFTFSKAIPDNTNYKLKYYFVK